MKNISEKQAKQILIWFGVIAVLIFGVLLPLSLRSSRNSPPPPQTKEPNNATARVMACDFVKENLTSPATARFPWSSDAYQVIETQGRYKVESYVDSQNAFGTPVRKKFVVIMSHNPTDQSWALEKIEFY